MVEPIDQVNFRRGREWFGFLAGFIGATTVSLLFRGEYGQALGTGVVLVSCIHSFQTRPRTTGPGVTGLLAVAGVGLCVAIWFGMHALLRGLA